MPDGPPPGDQVVNEGDSYLNQLGAGRVIDEPPSYHPPTAAELADFEAEGDVNTPPKDGAAPAPADKPKADAAPADKPPEKPADEPPKSPFEDVQHGGDYDPNAKPDAAKPDSEPDDGEPAAAEGRDGKKRARYEDVVKRASKAEEDLANERRLRVAREAEIEEYRRARAPAPASDAAKPADAGAEPAPAKPAAASALPPKPKEEDFDTTEAWSQKLDEWYEARTAAQVDERLAAARSDAEKQQESDAAVRARSEIDATVRSNLEHFRKHEKADEMAAALSAVKSPWYEPLKHGDDMAKSLTHFTTRHAKGGEALVFLGQNPEKAQALANLSGHPERHPGHVRAWVNLTAVTKNPVKMLDFMSTENGGNWFEALGTLPEHQQLVEIGSMEGRLAAVPAPEAARRGGPAAGDVSKAPPPATPPRGTSGTPAASSRMPTQFDGSKDSEPFADAEFERRMNRTFRDAAAAGSIVRPPVRRVVERHA